MDGYKHYIRTDANGIVIKGFTDAFEQMQTGDLLLSGQDGRHFQIQLTNELGQFRFKMENGLMTLRTQTELDTEWSQRPPQPPTLDDKVNASSVQINTLDERTQGMQDIDEFTLQQQITTDDRTEGMKEIDDYTLELVFNLQAQIDTLTTEIATLKGGA